MAVKWTAPRDQNLLLLIIQPLKLDYADLAKRWAEKFPEEDFKPTAKALSEHVAALKRKMGDSSGAASAAVRTPSSKTKTKIAPKTPTSKGKRSRAEMMSGEDDSEDEKAMEFDTPAAKRTTPSRHSVARRYKEEASDEEEDEEDVLITSARPPARTRDIDSVKPTTNGNGAVRSPGDIDSPRPSIARSKKNPPKLDYFTNNDGSVTEGSDFEPFT